jgi:hypothetical protein
MGKAMLFVARALSVAVPPRIMSSTATRNARRPGFRASMRRDVTNPNRVVPDPNSWRGRKAMPGPFRTAAELRYARNEMAEWNGVRDGVEGRTALSWRAMKLYEILCGIALSRRSLGRLDLSYSQLMRLFGVEEVAIAEADGSAAVDEWGEPMHVLDPEWGQGLRTLQRTLRELATAGFVSIGYVANRDCGGHRLCLELTGPEWFLDKVRAASDLGRAKGGRTSRPPIREPEQRRPLPGLQRRCNRCNGLGVIEQPDGSCIRCDHSTVAQGRASP